MEYTNLSNGVKVPLLGLGTFMISPEDTERSVYEGIKAGYRLVDTANAYMNEEAVGKGLRRALEEGLVKREDIFLSTKLWPTLYEKEDAVEKTLERLAGYKNIERAYQAGKARSLGISNIHGEKLEKLLEAAEVKPQVIQLETHPYCIQHETLDRLKEYGTKLMGWYPLGHGDKELLQEPVFGKLAAKYQKSTVQIVLRWAVQMGFITIPGTKNLDHLRANIDLFDFTLTPDEMAEIAMLDGKKRYYTADAAQEEKYASMHLPFEV